MEAGFPWGYLLMGGKDESYQSTEAVSVLGEQAWLKHFFNKWLNKESVLETGAPQQIWMAKSMGLLRSHELNLHESQQVPWETHQEIGITTN